jgi:4-hydroxy-3-polyprenylbenzoate decarboxylase
MRAALCFHAFDAGMTPAHATVDAESAGLPDWYRAVPVETCDVPLSVDVEIAQWLAEEERRRGGRPTVLFRRLREHPDARLLGNPYPRSVLLAAMDLPRVSWQRAVASRLRTAAPPVVRNTQTTWCALSGLDDMPVVRHRPGDAAKYVTAGVVVTPRARGGINLGVYRMQIVDRRRGLIFLDPASDGHRNWESAAATGSALPVAVFLGAHPAHIVVAASRIPDEGDDYEVVAKLLGRSVAVAGDPPVPVDATYVLRGVILPDVAAEGPFAEFKGYYVEPTQSPMFEIDDVASAPEPVYPMIVTGAESGLTLMAFHREYSLFDHLTSCGHVVQSVRYLLEARGEFLTVIEAPAPSLDLVRAAMAFDRRTKMVVCGAPPCQLWTTLASHGFEVHEENYLRKGQPYGQRIGLAFTKAPGGKHVEY